MEVYSSGRAAEGAECFDRNIPMRFMFRMAHFGVFLVPSVPSSLFACAASYSSASRRFRLRFDHQCVGLGVHDDGEHNGDFLPLLSSCGGGSRALCRGRTTPDVRPIRPDIDVKGARDEPSDDLDDRFGRAQMGTADRSSGPPNSRCSWKKSSN